MRQMDVQDDNHHPTAAPSTARTAAARTETTTEATTTPKRVKDSMAQQTKKARVPVSTAGRSVNDYETEEELRKALEDIQIVEGVRRQISNTKPDWRLPVPDPQAEEQTVETELRRLLTLKSYLLLDTEKEEAFDRLTQEARETYGVPTSLISLVDLGRQFLFSNTGNPGNVRETPRSLAFCAHTILAKNGICVVKDTTKDERFKDSKLVVEPPHLRFYAGAPLISPEGYKLGTFCVEGPEPRPEGLSAEQQAKLKEYATRAMELMVDRRRKVLQTQLLGTSAPTTTSTAIAADPEMKRHAGVTTNLGGVLYRNRECVFAMKLFQESVQSLMYCEEGEGSSENKRPSRERRKEMEHLWMLLSSDHLNEESRRPILDKVKALFEESAGSMDARINAHECSIGGIPGLFNANSMLKGVHSRSYNEALTFAEAFQIAMQDADNGGIPVDERKFIIPLDQCSKATLFNCGLIHYHWGSPDSAMQFFDLAASLSQANTALSFDPVVLACLNNMSQISLQYGRPNEAMEMLSDSLTRGNATLAAMYEEKPESSSEYCRDQEIRSRRLRRKLARTVMNIGHVHFFNCEYTAAMTACDDALRLLHTNMEEMEVAAVWYNKSVLLYHMDNKPESLVFLDKYIELATKLIGPEHAQIAEGLHRKGQLLFEMGNLTEALGPLSEALRIRRLVFGEKHHSVAETLCLTGKLLQAREEYDLALKNLEQGLKVQRELLAADELSFEVAQTLLDIGRAHHNMGKRQESLQVYQEVLDLTRQYFGPRHSFVARIQNIIGNLELERGNVDEACRHFVHAVEIHKELGLPVDLSVVSDPQLRAKLDPTTPRS